MKQNEAIYQITLAILENDPRASLTSLVLQVMSKVPEDEYSQKEVNRCWVEFKSVERSEQWLRRYCAGQDIGYDTLIRSVGYAKDRDDTEYLTIQGEDAYGNIDPDIWYHIEKITGITFSDPPTSFSCSC
jgi:hypothetical protein